MANASEVIKVVVEMALLGQRVLNVWHMVSSSPVADLDVLDDAAEFMDSLYTEVIAAMSTGLAFESVIVKNITADTNIGQTAWVGNATGSNAGDPLPPGVAALLTLPTLYPKVRGRKFIPGWCEPETTGGLFSNASIASLLDMGLLALTVFTGTASGQNWVFGVPRSAGGFAIFNDALVTNVPAYQRRRKQGVGG